MSNEEMKILLDGFYEYLESDKNLSAISRKISKEILDLFFMWFCKQKQIDL